MWPAKKNFPSDLMIGENLWEVRFKRTLKDGGVDISGLCDPSDRIIYIKDTNDMEDRFATLIHEVLHAIEFELECEIGEYKVRKFEKGLMQFLSQVLFV